ncbi:hypothetical protein O3G_MSEX014587 [Manduca sexta]|uniref:Uncharacterized protein n=1 Tax=Manduca sexta TaxID=7130 RepID=A0A921ZW19_MANSE|nr:hypothetical protein O3G_MSEX014587 [Manduca sexta]
MTLRVEVPGEKVVTVEPCKCSKQYGAETKTETRLSKSLKQYIKKLWAFRAKITVEPFVICYVLPSVLAGWPSRTYASRKHVSSTCSTTTRPAGTSYRAARIITPKKKKMYNEWSPR